jgi:hypothetical protein
MCSLFIQIAFPIGKSIGCAKLFYEFWHLKIDMYSYGKSTKFFRPPRPFLKQKKNQTGLSVRLLDFLKIYGVAPKKMPRSDQICTGKLGLLRFSKNGAFCNLNSFNGTRAYILTKFEIRPYENFLRKK